MEARLILNTMMIILPNQVVYYDGIVKPI